MVGHANGTFTALHAPFCNGACVKARSRHACSVFVRVMEKSTSFGAPMASIHILVLSTNYLNIGRVDRETRESYVRCVR
jgi:hypothetical protein